MIDSRDQKDHVELSIVSVQAQSDHSEPPRIILENPAKVKRVSALWNKISVISCVIAVFLDPLFLYIPIINREQRCLGKDNKLRIAALVLRSLTDITVLMNITFQIRERILLKAQSSKMKKPVRLPYDEGKGDDQGTQLTEESKIYDQRKKKIAQKLSWLALSVFVDILAVLPIPQVLLVYAFFEMRGSEYLDNRKILNTFLVGQYLPRIFRIFLSARKIMKTTRIWVKAGFNFLLYILASHLLGAFWYFFSIQRETSCWRQACVKFSNFTGCIDSFYCKDSQDTPNRTITFLNDYCPLNENITETQFHFGMFLESLESGNAGHVNFAQKFFYSFWWGLRNLSNFGTSLDKTSTYVWENCFAILISIVGLLLFLYLIGNVQTLMQFESTKWEEIRWKKRMKELEKREEMRRKIQMKELEEKRRKIRMKELDLQVWLNRNEIPDDLKKSIVQNIKKKLDEDKDASVDNVDSLFHVLPWDTRKSLKHFLCMSILVKAPMLKDANPRVVKMICDYLKPVVYAEKSDIFQVGEPLDSMLFITQGTVWTYSSAGDSQYAAGEDIMSAAMGSASPSTMITKSLEKGDSYGVEQLLSWVSGPNPNNKYSNLPGSTQNVRCHTKVEGFILMANDLKSVATKCKHLWDFAHVPASSQQRQEAARSTIAAAVRRFRNQPKQKSKRLIASLSR